MDMLNKSIIPILIAPQAGDKTFSMWVFWGHLRSKPQHYTTLKTNTGTQLELDIQSFDNGGETDIMNFITKPD
jgi:hypothetical protein